MDNNQNNNVTVDNTVVEPEVLDVVENTDNNGSVGVTGMSYPGF